MENLMLSPIVLSAAIYKNLEAVREEREVLGWLP